MPSNDRPRIPPVDEVQLLRAACCDWRLSRGDVGVLAVILDHCNAAAESFPGPARIASMARLAVTNAKASIRRLERLRYIEVQRRGLKKRSAYKVLASPSCPTRVAAATIKDLRGHFIGRASIPSSQDATGRADMHESGRADVPALGMPARQEVAFKSLQVTCEETSGKREAGPRHISDILEELRK